MPLYVILGIGIGNLGRTQVSRRPMPEWVRLLNEDLATGSPSVHIVRYFGHTGNFLADSVSTDLEQLRARLEGLLKTEWVVRPLPEVQMALKTLADATQPPVEPGIRWTTGLAFRKGAGVSNATVRTPRAVFCNISPFIVGVWKRDNLDGRGVLDRERRSGGWGAIAGDLERQIGGRWTARSGGTLAGLVRGPLAQG